MMESDMTYQNKLDLPEIAHILFHPRRDDVGTKLPAGSSQQMIPVEGAEVGARLHRTANARATILLFHGNGEVASDYDHVAASYLEKQINFLVVDYRGYGMSSGAPSASTLLKDAHTVLDFIKTWMQEEGMTGPLIVMGRSLGSAPAIELAASRREEVRALIIESGFAYSMPVLRTLGVDVDGLGLDEDMGFGNARKMKAVTQPTLILHGQRDQIISLENAAELQNECSAKVKQLFIVPGADHNTLMEVGGSTYFDTISQFVDKFTAGPPRWKRKKRRKP